MVPGFEFGGAGIDQVLLFREDAEVALGFGGAGFRAHVVDCELGFDCCFGVTFQDADELGEVAVGWL